MKPRPLTVIQEQKSVTILTPKAVITAFISRGFRERLLLMLRVLGRWQLCFQLSPLAALPTLDVLLHGVSLVLRLSWCLREAQPIVESQRLRFRGLRDPLEEAF